ncbi:hypothetical protein HY212_02250 [Candidatus Pacearchaeota archaeon]|nr:hypothetical protein [Candidatus Pacearchaeota archaeon]
MLTRKIKNKSGQAWSLDVVIAIVIFTIGIVLLYVYAINYFSKSDELLNNLFYEGNIAAQLILSDDDLGILSGDAVNQTKLDQFNSSYDQKKTMLGITKDFYFSIDGMVVNDIPASYVGMKSQNPENVVQITRITIYNNKPVKFQLYIWE